MYSCQFGQLKSVQVRCKSIQDICSFVSSWTEKSEISRGVLSHYQSLFARKTDCYPTTTNDHHHHHHHSANLNYVKVKLYPSCCGSQAVVQYLAALLFTELALEEGSYSFAVSCASCRYTQQSSTTDSFFFFFFIHHHPPRDAFPSRGVSRSRVIWIA